MEFEIYNDRFRARINSTGAELRSFQDRSLEFIWQADPQYWGESAPWLFPIVCDLRNGQVEIEGQTYSMERHGFAHKMEFQATRLSDSSISFALCASEATLRQYPYAFQLEICYSLTDKGLSICAKVTNRDHRAMYYNIGGHPGFRCPIFPETNFEEYRIVLDRPEHLDCPILEPDTRLINPSKRNLRLDGDTISLRYELFQKDVLILDGLSSRGVCLVAPNGKGIRVEFPDYAMLGLWTMAGCKAPYVCIEPWNGGCTYTHEDNRIEHKRLIQSLEPGASKDYHMDFLPIL